MLATQLPSIPSSPKYVIGLPPIETELAPPTSADNMSSAMMKLHSACSVFDKIMQDKVAQLRSMSLGVLSPRQLRDLLHHIMGVTFTKEELGEVVKYFDKNGDGDVDFVELRRAILKIVDEARRHKESARKAGSKKARQRYELLEQEHRKKHVASNEADVEMKFGERHKVQALRKIAKAASTFDPGRSGNSLSAFEGILDPTGFRDQLWNVFRIKVNAPQLGALMAHFDGDASGAVDGSEFKLEFCRISAAAKEAMKIAQEQHQKKVKEHYDKMEQKQIEKFAKAPETKYDKNFTLVHYEKAITKLGNVAKFHDPERAQSTQGFQGLLDPAAFKEQLKRCFNVQFSQKELGALITHFDRDMNGIVDGTEFLIGFYSLAAKVKAEEKEKLLRDNERRKIALKTSIIKLKKKNNLTAARLRPIVAAVPELLSAVDRVKTAAALDLSDDIRLGKLLAVSMEEIYGADPRRAFSVTSLPPLKQQVDHFGISDGEGGDGGGEDLEGVPARRVERGSFHMKRGLRSLAD